MVKVSFFLITLAGLFFQPACNQHPAGEDDRQPEPETAKTAVAGKPDPPKPENTRMEFDLSYVMGQFDPAAHPDFVQVDLEFANREGMYLRKDTYEAFKKMAAAAQADGVKLKIISATRNFNQQKQIWEAKWTGARTLEGGESAPTAYPKARDRAMAILRYSSMPGSSRHHWGTDVDLNNLNNVFFDKGEGKTTYDWLKENAAAFGFAQPYTAGRPFGYNEERWHWSYLPVATQLTKMAQDSLADQMIKGFKGAETAAEIQIVEHYVLGINPECLP